MSRACLLILALLAAPAAARAQGGAGCAVALVLAMDVSRSVDAAEFALIRNGTAAAFRDPALRRLVESAPGGVLVTLTQWSGADQQRQSIPWRVLAGGADLDALAAEIETVKRAYRFSLTAPGNALQHAASLFARAPLNCRRRVIDLAGDGVRNTGLPTGAIGDRLAARGITVNGLVVRGDSPDPLAFYRSEVRRGAASFVEVATGYADFPRAMLLKLLRELSPALSALPQARGPG